FFTIVFGLFSLFIKERLYISETVISTLFGIAIGEKGLNILDKMIVFSLNGKESHNESEDVPQINDKNVKTLRQWGVDPDLIMFYLSRLVISFQVVAVGSIIPFTFLKSNIFNVILLIGPIMVITYVISFLIIYLFLRNTLPLFFCLMIAACVTPTDPVIASSILKGKFANRYIPKLLRNLLIVEGGINDGLAYPLLTLPLFFIQGVITRIFTLYSDNSDVSFLEQYSSNSISSLWTKLLNMTLVKKVISRWLYFTFLYEVIFACFFGLFIGYCSKRMLIFSKGHNLIDKENGLCYLLGLSLLVTGLTGLLKSDDILASFFCGIAFSYTHEQFTVDEPTEAEVPVLNDKKEEEFVYYDQPFEIESDHGMFNFTEEHNYEQHTTN
ncbi:Monovalent Cation:Proton Antiporter-1 (CPA1) Family, partial [Pseudoloma neurophilia]